MARKLLEQLRRQVCRRRPGLIRQPCAVSGIRVSAPDHCAHESGKSAPARSSQITEKKSLLQCDETAGPDSPPLEGVTMHGSEVGRQMVRFHTDESEHSREKLGRLVVQLGRRNDEQLVLP